MMLLSGGDTVQKYDYSKLFGKIKECGYTQEKLAQEINISACSLNLTLNNKRGFRQNEILEISKVLGIRSGEIEEYFFAH